MLSASPAAEILARFYAALDVADLPEATMQAVRRHLLDTLGAALAGAAQPEPVAVLAAGRVTHGEGGRAILWGRPDCAAPALAALVNGTAAHALELDDASGCDHSGAVVVPALLAALPLAPRATGADLIAAVVAGYDLGRRVMEAAGGYDAHNGAGWHSTGTCGVFGAAVAVARLWRLPPEVMRHTLGIAGSSASGNWSFLAEGAMTKRLHPGHAASAGVIAAAMARAGMTGPSGVFDAPWGGFLGTYARDAADPDALTRGLGEMWRIHRSSIKPYASCRGTHAAVEAALELRDTVPADMVQAVEVGVHPTIVRMCGAAQSGTLLEAQMSMPYAVAVAWLRGDAGLPSFTPELRGSTQVTGWMRRVTVVEDASVPSNIAARLTVRAADGAIREARLDTPIGSWNRPLPEAALRAKYRGLAGAVLGTARTTELEEKVMALGPGDDPAGIVTLLQTPGVA